MARILPLLLLLLAAPALAQGTLRVGIQDDPNMLDPAQSGAFVDRIAFAPMCDRLVDLDRDLSVVPQLATGWSWSEDRLALTLTLRPGVTFHDGAPMDAEAVAANLERYRTARESRRKGELGPLASVEVVDALTVRLRLSRPFAPLLVALTDRAGMMLSPRTLADPAAIARGPVCAGPFRFVRRIAQERLDLARYDGYWDAGRIHLDGIVIRPIPDGSVRLLNLRAGALDLIERLPPTDIRDVRADARLKLIADTAVGYYTISFNITNGPRAQSPLARDARVRAALEAAVDREVINQVVMDGQYVASNQMEPPQGRFWNPARPVPPRDLARARALLKEAGHERVSFVLNVGQSPVEGQVAQVIQAMAAEAGIDVRIMVTDAAAMVGAADRGDFDAYLGIWSGRADPDGNVSIWLACDGFLNRGKYCNPALDRVLEAARQTTDVDRRIALYREASGIYLDDRPHMVLYHLRWLWASRDTVSGFAGHPDGLIRPQDIRLR